MIRWFFVTALLSAAAILAVWSLSPHLASAPPAAVQTDTDKKGPRTPPPSVETPPRLARAAVTRGPLDVVVYRNNTPEGLNEPIIISDAHLVIVDKQEVPSEKEGVIKFIGTEVRAGEQVPRHKQLPKAELGFLALAIGDKAVEGEDCFQLPNDALTWYRRAKFTEVLEPNKVFLFQDSREVRKLQVGDRVVRGQLLALINPAKSFDDISMKLAVLNSKAAERDLASKEKLLYAERYRNHMRINQTNPGTIPHDTLQETRISREKYTAEEEVKKREIEKSQSELRASMTDLKMHEVRAAIDGVVKAIYKNHQGDAVKPFEAILRIENPGRLRVEGRLELQEASKLKVGMTAIVEASRPVSPRLVIPGHLLTVNCVAVSKGNTAIEKGKRPVIVSGSEDETLRGWDAVSGDKLWKVKGLHSAVRAVACTPAACARNLACFGCADGKLRLLDLDHPEQKPRELSERHRGPVHSIAFSPDGETIASGGDDRVVRLWKTESGSLLHTLANHSGPVTSVQFASAKRLVTAGKDFRLVVWDVEAGKPPRPISPRFEGRSGEVLSLGVSPDGKTVLFDQGKELRLLTLEDSQIVGTLQNPSDAWNFATMALFSPDGKTILTNGSSPGKLQLWRTPATATRGSELRQFIWKSTATCGAFAPEDSTLAVTGTQDHQVLVWSMPSKEEIDSRLEAQLTLVEHSFDTQSRDVKVWAELDSPEWLVPGSRATMVVQPPRK
jgi:WD40 repeat protein